METIEQKKKGEQKSLKQVQSGVVVSDKMKDTIVVLAKRFVKHTKYQKFFETSKRYKVHDPGNTKKIGDKVMIEECRPISKDKRFKLRSTNS